MDSRTLRHVAIIMDGNGRWARARGLPRLAGHRQGAAALRRVVGHCREAGLRYLTLFAFSTENWGRPAPEVQGLMELLARFLAEQGPELRGSSIELAAIGDLDRLPPRARRLLDHAVESTRGAAGMRLTLALSYGGRDELVRASRRLAGLVADGRLRPHDIDSTVFERALDTADTPPVDLLIRTGGEHRLSNFVLWQAAYAELCFTDRLWPDFGPDDLDDAVAWYHDRRRTFGLVEAVG